jgi:hypothetical protein
MSALVVIYEAVVIADGQKSIEQFAVDAVLSKNLEEHLADYIAKNQPEMTLVKTLSVMLDHKCIACRFGELGQSAHMEEDGCLDSAKRSRNDSE